MAGPITPASLPGSAMDAPIAPMQNGDGGVNLPPGLLGPVNLSAFGATPLPVQNLLSSMQPQQAVSPRDIANALVASISPPSPSVTSNGQDSGGEGFVQHVLDFLNIGNYATATAAEQGIDAKNRDLHNGDNFLQAAGDTAWNTVLGFGHGIAGAFGDSRPGDKTDWADVLMKHGPDAAIFNGTQKTIPDYQQNEANKFLNDQDGGHRPTDLTRPITQDDLQKIAEANALEGTGIDIFGDPLNLVNAPGKVAELIKGGLKGLKGTQDANDATRLANAENLENLLKDYKNPTDVGVQNDAGNIGQVPQGVTTVANDTGNSSPLFAPGSLVGAQKDIEAGLSSKAAGIAPKDLNGDIPTTPPGIPPVSAGLNAAFKAGLQNALGSVPSTASDLIKPVDSSGKIDEDFFNQMMRDHMETSVPKTMGSTIAPTAEELKSPAAATGAFSDAADEATRQKIVSRAVSNVLRNSDGKGWAYSLLNELGKTHGSMNDLDKTATFLDRMAKQLPALKNADLGKLRGALSRTLEADYAEHLKANKALKAKEIVQAVSEGDQVASKAAEPAHVTPNPLSDDDAKIATAAYKKYYNQILGNGHFDGLKNPDAYDAKIASGATKLWAGPKQVNMYRFIADAVRVVNPKLPAAARLGKTAKILREVEDAFIKRGAVPFSAADSRFAVPLRMTDVFAKIPPHILETHADHLTTILKSAFTTVGEVSSPSLLKAVEQAPELKDAFDQAFEASKAGGVISEIPKMQPAIEAAGNDIEAAKQAGVSDARVTQATTIAQQAAKDIIRQAGGTEASVNTATDLIKQAYAAGDKFQNSIVKNHLNNLSALSKDDINPGNSSVMDVNKALHTILGGPTIGNLGNVVGPAANATGWLGGRIAGSYGLFGDAGKKLSAFLGERFNPAWNNHDLRPLFVQGLSSARAISGRDANIYNTLMRQLQHDPETIRAGMLAAQGHKPAVIGSDAEKWAKQFQAHAENLVGSMGLTKVGLLSDTVAARGQLLMKELNAAGKRFGLPGKFTNAKDVKDALGKTVDLSQGADWLKSWQTWDIKDPVKFMMQLSNTVNHTTREAKMFEEMASRFGRLGKTTIDHPRLKGIHFDADMAAQVRQFIKNLNDFKKPSNKLGRLADMALSKYKSAATMYIPAHHVRAALGDVYLSWLAGVEDPSAYTQSLKVMRSQAGRYQGFEDASGLTGHDAVSQAIARATGRAPVAFPKGADVVFTLKNGQHVTNDMVYSYMFQHGLLPTANHLLDIPEEDAMAKVIAPFNGRLSGFLHQATETREHYIRIAHFIDTMKRTGGTFENAASAAAADVRRWHPDGTDLTDFERRVVRRLFPFYSWSRKVMPLIMESLLMRPTKISAYPRAMYAVGLATGAQNPLNGSSETDPFPTDALFPNWLRDKGVGPIGGSAMGGYVSVTPNIPSMDILEQIAGLTSDNQSDRANAWSSLLNPGIRVPEELLTGQTLGGSAIMTPKSGYGQYLLKQIPQVQQYAGISNITSTDPNQQAGTLNVDKLLNFLAAAGISNDGQYQKQAANDYMTNQRIAAGTGF